MKRSLRVSVALHRNPTGANLPYNGMVPSCSAIGNDADGITTDDHCLVQSCVASHNGERGLIARCLGNRVEGNQVAGNDGGIWVCSG